MYRDEQITIFIDKSLAIADNIEITLKYNLPLIGPSFKVTGVFL